MSSISHIFHKRQYAEFHPIFGLLVCDDVEEELLKYDIDILTFFKCESTCTYNHVNLFNMIDIKKIDEKGTRNVLKDVEEYVYQKTSNFVDPEFVKSLHFFNPETQQIEKFCLRQKPTDWANHTLSLLYNPFRSQDITNIYQIPRVIIIFSKDPSFYKNNNRYEKIFQAKNENFPKYFTGTINITVEINDDQIILKRRNNNKDEQLFNGSLTEDGNQESINYISNFTTSKRKIITGSLFKFFFNFFKHIISNELKPSLEKSVKNSIDELNNIQNKKNLIKKAFSSKKNKIKMDEELNDLKLKIVLNYLILDKYDEAKEMLAKMKRTSYPYNLYQLFLNFHFSLSHSKNISKVKDLLISILEKKVSIELAAYLLFKFIDYITSKIPKFKSINVGFSVLFLPYWTDQQYLANYKELIPSLTVLRCICLERLAQASFSNSPRKSALLLHFIPILYSFSVEHSIFSSNQSKVGHALFASVFVHRILSQSLKLKKDKVFVCGSNNLDLLTNPVIKRLPWQDVMNESLEIVAHLLKNSNKSSFIPLIYLNLIPIMNNEASKTRAMMSLFDVYNRKETDRDLISQTYLPFLNVEKIQIIDYGSPSYSGLNEDFFYPFFDYWKKQNVGVTFSELWNLNDLDNSESKVKPIVCNENIKIKIKLSCVSKEVPFNVDNITVIPKLINEDNTDDNWFICDKAAIYFNGSKNSTSNSNHNNQKVVLNAVINKACLFELNSLGFCFWGLSNIRIPIALPTFQCFEDQPSISAEFTNFPKEIIIGEIVNVNLTIKNSGLGAAKNVTLMHNFPNDLIFDNSTIVTSSFEGNDNFFRNSKLSLVKVTKELQSKETIELSATLICSERENPDFNFVIFYLGQMPIKWRTFCFNIKANKVKAIRSKMHCIINPKKTDEFVLFSNFLSEMQPLYITNAIINNEEYKPVEIFDSNIEQLDSFKVNEKENSTFLLFKDSKSSMSNTKDIILHNKDSFGVFNFHTDEKHFQREIHPYDVLENLFSFVLKAPNVINIGDQKFSNVSVSLTIINKENVAKTNKITVLHENFEIGNIGMWVGKVSNFIDYIEPNGQKELKFQLVVFRPGMIELASKIIIIYQNHEIKLPFSHFLYIK